MPDGGEQRNPRGVVTINGTRVDWESFEVEANRFSEADTFKVCLPASALPDDLGPTWWGGATKAEVEIFAGFPDDPDAYSAGDLVSLILGQVDDVAYDPVAGTIELDGRDLTATMVDTKTSEKYPDNRASAIVQRIAAAHGLTPVVTATTAKAGKYYGADHVRVQSQRSEWELITYLAAEEGFVAYVTGRELHFEPQAGEGEPVVITFQTYDDAPSSFYGDRLQFSRSLTVAKDITVKVRSWNTKQKKGFVKTAHRAASNAETQEYSYSVPNLTPEEAQQRANKLLLELTRHELKVSIEQPADVTLKVSDKIEIRGTGTPWDQAYYLDSITRRMTCDGGFAQWIEAKNHPTTDEPTL